MNSILRIVVLSIILHVCAAENPETTDRIYPYNPAEKYSKHWYDKGIKDLNKAINLKPNTRVAKNVILFIGDGMGITTLTAARILKGQRNGISGEEGSLFFETLPYASLVKTFNVDHQVPDSAGTASAFLTGVKANFETLGVNAQVNSQETNCELIRQNSVPSILKWAVDSGKHAGVVTTTRITHATPAASYSHVAHRDWENDASLPENLDPACKDIARQLIEDDPGKNFRVILGGGRKNFLPKSFNDPAANQNGARKDGNLIEKWLSMRKAEGLQNHQYKWINSTKGLQEVSKNLARVDYLFGLFNYNHMSYDAERDRSPDGEPSLADMTSVAIRLLRKNDQGFVLLVEGGRIDHAHHKNLASMALSETLALDQAIEAATQLVDMDETLIIVTADHSHTLTMNGYPVRGNDIMGQTGSNDTSGRPFETLMYGSGPGHREGSAVREGSGLRRVHNSAVHTNDSHHDGRDVALYSDGPYAHLFQGLIDQTYIAHVMSYASCIGLHNETDHCLLKSFSHTTSATPLLLVTIFALIFKFNAFLFENF